MDLTGALSAASSGIANIERQLSLVSQNIANASTPGYAREVAGQTAVTADGAGSGVRTLAATRVTDAQLSAALLSQSSAVSGLQTTTAALQAVDAAQGTVGQGGDLPSLLGALSDAFSTLGNDPANQTQQQAVVQAAQSLAGGINTLAGAYGTGRQSAQDGVVSGVAQLNAALGTVGSLSDRIVSLHAAGKSTADLENQRDAVLSSVSTLLDVKTLPQPDGDVLLFTASGTALPIHGGANPVSSPDAAIGPASVYPGGGIPPVTVGGVDVTAQLRGGSIGASLTLRDSTLPTFQAELDEFSQNLASRFDQQGMRLFTDPSGAVPAAGGVPPQSGYVGFANAIGVNPAVTAAPQLVRDGTQAVAGSATGASAFTPNPPGGPAGFSGLITRVLDYALGPNVQAGVAQPASQTVSLGPAGTLNAPYAAPGALSAVASALAAAQARTSAAATSQLATEQAAQTSLQSRVSAASGVTIDAEMSNMVVLQNAYGANARVISAAQALWTQLLQVVN